MYEHMDPDEQMHVILKMRILQWFVPYEEGEDSHQRLMQLPLVRNKPRTNQVDPRWLARNLMLVRCWEAGNQDVPKR